MRDALSAIVREELHRPILGAATHLAEHVRTQHTGIGPMLFYGSCLRAESPEGVMDLYLLTRGQRAFNPTLVMAAANELVPPNIYFWSVPSSEGELRAKGAALTQKQFRRSCRIDAWSPSVWARFCQPARLVDTRDEQDVVETVESVVDAIVTASHWAAHLGPTEGTAHEFWVELFRSTYAVELRPERSNRPGIIVDADPERYEKLLPLAWAAAGIEFEQNGDVFRPQVRDREQARAAWDARIRLGKLLSAARIVKGAFTFDGAVDYLLWKIERHSGVKVEATEWQKRHPFLAAPKVFAKLWRAGAIR